VTRIQLEEGEFVTRIQLEEWGVCDANTIRGGEEFVTQIQLEEERSL
jgi:hypothetical protein